MRLSILIYDGFTTLDAVGGYEILSRLPGMETEFVAATPGVIAADTRALGLLAWKGFDEVRSTDILYVPGGPGGFAMEKDERFLAKLRDLDATSTWTFGVCNGVGILGAAGLLKGRTAACNWFYQKRLAAHGATFSPARYHRDGKYVTTAGVSAGIDGALYLASLIAGEAVAKALQLGIEYYPAPPFPEKAPLEAPKEIYALIEGFEKSEGREQLAQRPVFEA
ncbi:MAG: DJ-1/PfpI family protein [Proteobacteria bacterium]|nr:DJ-1/PfpI family protein [Pseudomonadota bacterium]